MKNYIKKVKKLTAKLRNAKNKFSKGKIDKKRLSEYQADLKLQNLEAKIDEAISD